MFFFFKQKTAYDMRISDWSSDVCSSDLSSNMRAAECSTRALRWMIGMGISGTMAAMSKKSGKDKANGGGTIALNKRARHEYHIEESFEAGLALQGCELK